MAFGRLVQELDAGEVTGVTALVEVEHQRVALPEQPAHHRPANKAGTAGHQDAAAADEQGTRRRAGRIQTRAEAYACTKLIAVGIREGCLGWFKQLGTRTRRCPGGGWGLTAKPCWKASLAVLLA